MTWADPPDKSTFLSRPSAKNARNRPSGDQKGWLARPCLERTGFHRIEVPHPEETGVPGRPAINASDDRLAKRIEPVGQTDGKPFLGGRKQRKTDGTDSSAGGEDREPQWPLGRQALTSPQLARPTVQALARTVGRPRRPCLKTTTVLPAQTRDRPPIETARSDSSPDSDPRCAPARAGWRPRPSADLTGPCLKSH